MLPVCQYTYKSDFPKINFKCQEECGATGDKHCIFHDKDRYPEYKNEAYAKFRMKVLLSITDNIPLECIGYILPAISFAEIVKEKRFLQPVYFNAATFYEGADFSEVTFFNRVDFSEVTFLKIAYFHKFSNKSKPIEDTLSNQRMVSYDAVSFMEANFHESSVFSHATFEGGVNYSQARFHKNAIFFNTHFFERAIFYGSKFLRGDASFQQSEFLKGEVTFAASEFSAKADFTNVHFAEGVDFSESKIYNEATFVRTKFDKETRFRFVLFEKQERVFVDEDDLSLVSFLYTDITRIRIGGKVKWGEIDEFRIYDEKEIERSLNKVNGLPQIDLDSILSVYRNLRENFEYRRRYGEAGRFFVREMEVRRHYREEYEMTTSKPKAHKVIKKNNWWRRNIFSLTAWYFHLSRYGEDLLRPTITGMVVILLSTLFFVMQSNPTLEPTFPAFINTYQTGNNSSFVGLDKTGELSHWQKAFERSMADFLPLLPMGSQIHTGLIDYIIKIVGGAFTFVLIAIALRRKFERKYIH